MIPVTNINTLYKVSKSIKDLELKLSNSAIYDSEEYINRQMLRGNDRNDVVSNIKKYKDSISDEITTLKLFFNNHISDCSNFSIFTPYEIN